MSSASFRHTSLYAGSGVLKPWLEDRGYFMASVESLRQHELSRRDDQIPTPNPVNQDLPPPSNQKRKRGRKSDAAAARRRLSQPSSDDEERYAMKLDHCVMIDTAAFVSHTCLSGGMLSIPMGMAEEREKFYELYTKDVMADIVNYCLPMSQSSPTGPNYCKEPAQHSLSGFAHHRAFKAMIDMDLELWDTPGPNEQFYIGIIVQLIARAFRNCFPEYTDAEWETYGLCYATQSLARPTSLRFSVEYTLSSSSTKPPTTTTTMVRVMPPSPPPPSSSSSPDPWMPMDENAIDGIVSSLNTGHALTSSSASLLNASSNITNPLQFSMSMEMSPTGGVLMDSSSNHSISPTSSLGAVFGSSTMTATSFLGMPPPSSRPTNATSGITGENLSSASSSAIASNTTSTRITAGATEYIYPHLLNRTLQMHKIGVHIHFPNLVINARRIERVRKLAVRLIVNHLASDKTILERCMLVLCPPGENGKLPTYQSFNYYALLKHWDKILDNGVYDLDPRIANPRPHLRPVYSHKVVTCKNCTHKKPKLGANHTSSSYICKTCGGTGKASAGPAAIYDLVYVFNGNLEVPKNFAKLQETDTTKRSPSIYAPAESPGSPAQVRYNKLSYAQQEALLEIAPILVARVDSANMEQYREQPKDSSMSADDVRSEELFALITGGIANVGHESVSALTSHNRQVSVANHCVFRIVSSPAPIRRFPTITDGEFKYYCHVVKMTDIYFPIQSVVGMSEDAWNACLTPGFFEEIDLDCFGEPAPWYLHPNHGAVAAKTGRKAAPEVNIDLDESSYANANTSLTSTLECNVTRNTKFPYLALRKVEYELSKFIRNCHPNWHNLVLLSYRLVASPRSIKPKETSQLAPMPEDHTLAINYKGPAFMVEANGSMGAHFCTCRAPPDDANGGIWHSHRKVTFVATPTHLYQVCPSESTAAKHAAALPIGPCIRLHGMVKRFPQLLTRLLFPTGHRRGLIKELIDQVEAHSTSPFADA